MDFEKAYDSVSWEFLDYMLGSMGFNMTWRKWIQECLGSSSVSVLVNGSPLEEFSVSKGLRQGDPMTPFLFLVVAEGLSGIINNAVDKGIFKAYNITEGEKLVMVSHIQYADDTAIVGEASLANVVAIKSILRAFELTSVLRVNFFKSHLVGLKEDEALVRQASSILNYRVGKTPFNFLGIQVGGNPRKSSYWDLVIKSVRRRLLG